MHPLVVKLYKKWISVKITLRYALMDFGDEVIAKIPGYNPFIVFMLCMMFKLFTFVAGPPKVKKPIVNPYTLHDTELPSDVCGLLWIYSTWCEHNPRKMDKLIRLLLGATVTAPGSNVVDSTAIRSYVKYTNADGRSIRYGLTLSDMTVMSDEGSEIPIESNAVDLLFLI